ncbi:MAG: hypothetical protein AB4206_14980 [Xenococcaceae cyanobacterium]
MSEILAEQEILISAATLKQYLTEINKQSAARKKRIKSGKSQKSKSLESKSNSITSSEDVTLPKDESEQDSLQVKPDKLKEVESSYSNKQKELNKSQTKTKVSSKSLKTKPKELSGSNQDLSSEFNQY